MVRHIFDEGKLDCTGTDTAHENVVREGASCQSFRILLGQEEPSVATGIFSCLEQLKGGSCLSVSSSVHIYVFIIWLFWPPNQDSI